MVLESLEKIQAKSPDIVLTDINMPQMNGIKLAQLVKERVSAVHIIFLTGMTILIMLFRLLN